MGFLALSYRSHHPSSDETKLVHNLHADCNCLRSAVEEILYLAE